GAGRRTVRSVDFLVRLVTVFWQFAPVFHYFTSTLARKRFGPPGDEPGTACRPNAVGSSTCHGAPRATLTPAVGFGVLGKLATTRSDLSLRCTASPLLERPDFASTGSLSTEAFGSGTGSPGASATYVSLTSSAYPEGASQNSGSFIS